jgi:hypothetical protein
VALLGAIVVLALIVEWRSRFHNGVMPKRKVGAGGTAPGCA